MSWSEAKTILNAIEEVSEKVIPLQIKVQAPIGSTIVCSKDGISFSKTVDTNGFAYFDIPSFGVWTLNATRGIADTKVTTINCIEHKQYFVDIQYATIMGISRNINDSSPAWTRTDSAVDLTFTRGIGTSGYHSDFDTMPIYKNIVRETINGDIMVKIPKFYYERKVVNNVETIRISDIAEGISANFSLHPLFINGENELDYVYVGAYETGNGYVSQSGKAPLVNITRSASRTGHKNRGTGYSQFDIACWSALQMLMLVEIANNNVQAVIGNGNANTNAAIATGGCDAMYNAGQLSGCAINDSSHAIIWRGIENLWGNVWKWVDGVNWNGGTYHVCTDPSKYADDTASDYVQLSYIGGSTSYSQSYIKNEGCDSNNAFAMLPTVAGGSETTYYCDAIWSSTGWRVCACSGRWANGSVCGLFAVSLNIDSSASDSYIGARLLYRPQ